MFAHAPTGTGNPLSRTLGACVVTSLRRGRPTRSGACCAASREHHFVADGPVHNGCPGEALTPAELFLAGVAACGVELMEVLARGDGMPLTGARAAIEGELDPDRPVRDD